MLNGVTMKINVDDYIMEIIEYNDLYVRYHYYK